MAVARHHIWSIQEYLVHERVSNVRHEFYRGEVLAMAGGSPDHSQICLNAGTEINQQLKKRDCTAYESNMLIRTGDEVYTYPDLSVVCGKPRIEFNIVHMLLNPTLIVEVLSPGTERYDRGEKFEHYQTLQTLQEYVLIAQDSPRIERYSRADDGQWSRTVAVGLDAVIDLPAIGCTLALADVYHKTSLHTPKA